METWKVTEGAKYGIAIYNFDGKVNHGLSLDIGDAVQIFESCAGWYRGCCLINKAVKGIFPSSFIQLKECIVENLRTPLEVIIPNEDPVIREVASVLREWLELWKGLFQNNQREKFLEMTKLMNQLIDIRQRILSGALTRESIVELKKEISSKIDLWNSQMGLDLVPRLNGEAVEVDQMSVVELYKIHDDSLKKSKKLESEAAIPRSSLSIIRAHRHILLTVKRFFCNVEDYLEVFFSLFSGESGQYLSERFVICLNKDVMPDIGEVLGAAKTKTLFTDLGRKSFASDVYVVCHVVRTGQMHSDQSTKKKNVNFRRPFACGVFNVQENFPTDDLFGDEAFSVPLYPCNSDAEFHNLHEVLIRKGSNKLPTSSNDGISMEVSIKLFNGDREKAIKSNPLWIPPDIPITRKLGFPEIILPGDIRNDIYITLDRGEFEKGPKTSAKNVEVCLLVLMSNGTVLKDCVYAGTGNKSINEYQSLIFYHNNFPKWNETIKLNIPPDKFQDCHVLFLFKHCPTSNTLSNVRERTAKIFAFAFLKPLKADGTTIVDGGHQLVMYKTNLLDFKNPGKYLSYPSFVSDLAWVENQQHLNNSMRNTKELFFVTSLICSTKLTQNIDLVGLLKWRQQREKIPDVLTSLMKVPGGEIVKFLQDIFDALFSILNDDTEKSGMLIFKNLTFVINLLLANKFEQFQPVLNTYIKYHFSAALAHRHLVVLFNQFMSTNNDVIALLKVAKALTFILKFIMQSWLLYIRTHPEHSNFEFKQSVHELFTHLNKAMGKTGDGWRGIQRAILSGLPKVYVELTTVFKDEELAEMLQNIFCSAQSDTLTSDKLNFLDGIITTSPLFHNASSRVTLMPLLLNCLHQQLLQKNELKTCADLLGNLLTCLSKSSSVSVHDEVDQISKALLQVVFQAVVTVNRTSPRAGQYVAILFALLKMMSEEHYQSYLQSFTNLKNLRDFLNKAFGVFTNLLQRDIYPDDWFVMKIEGNYVILGAVQNISRALTDNFLLNDAFDYQLWNSYFHLAISFVSHEILNLDKYSEAKRLKILEKYGDMRHVMGFEIVTMWNSLGDLQSNFIPSMIAPFLKMTLVPEPVLRKETLPIFYDMIKSEMKNHGNIDRVEEEFINKLDVFLSNDGMGDENYKELFEEILTEKIKENSSLMQLGISFVNSVTQLLKRLLDYRNVISSREEHRDMKMTCIVNLMNYYDEKGKEDMYLRYVAKLYSLHLAAENYCEAGFALYLYASRLEFEEWPLNAEENFPAQTESERKESLYKKAIEHFDKGELWESGIRLCKKLINLYENDTFDFIKLSETLKTQAEFYNNIMNEYRPEPVYFRVGFYGKAFPSFLQNKQFIYRGKQLEKIGEFCFRIQSEYPDAEVLRHNNPLKEELLLSNKQYIQCCEVKPVADNLVVPGYVNKTILSYYKVNWVSKFWFSRPFHKGEWEKSNEFATLWSEVITLTTETVLPAILPWLLVVASESMELSPIENAINTVRSKTCELENVVEDLQEKASCSINPLSMILNGIIDPAVNGGIANYRKAFFTPEYTRTNPKRKIEVDKLEDALHEQAAALRRALIFHESQISSDLGPLHEKLLNNYNKMVDDLPGEAQGYMLIQRKWSIPMSPSPSQGSPSSDRRISVDSGTLPQKLKTMITGRRTTLSYIYPGEENNEQSVGSTGMKQSTSLTSFSDHSPDVSQSVSVPDLRDIGGLRPKLPKKRIRKQLNEPIGSRLSSSLSRTSVDSSTSINSLTEIDESGEVPQGHENSWKSSTDGSFISHTSSTVAMHNRVTNQDNVAAPVVPSRKQTFPKFLDNKKVSQSPEKKKRHSGFLEVTSAAGLFKTLKKPSQSLDDLDKIDDESKNGPEMSTSKCTRSHDSLNNIGDEQLDKNCEIITENNVDNEDEETPPPLMPRTFRTNKNVDEPYDTLALPPSLSKPVKSATTHSHDTLNYSRFNPPADIKTLKLNPKTKHYYANLGKSSTTGEKLVRNNELTGDLEEPYDTLAVALPNQQTNRTLGRDYHLSPSRKDAYDFVTQRKSDSLDTFSTWKQGTVVNNFPSDSIDSCDRFIGQEKTGKYKDQSEVINLDDNSNPSWVPSGVALPILPPKHLKKNIDEIPPPVAQRTTSPLSSQESSPSNSPSRGRKKPPMPLPKPRHTLTRL